MVAYKEGLYVFGGRHKETGTYYKDIWWFDMTTKFWTKLRCPGLTPSARRAHAATLIGDVVFSFGGEDKDKKPLGDIWVFRINERTWHRLPDINQQPSTRLGHVLVTVLGHLVVIGGLRWRWKWGADVFKYVDAVNTLDVDVASRALGLTLFQPDPHGSKINNFTKPTNNVGSNTLETSSEGAKSLVRQVVVARHTWDTITGAMPTTEILQRLVAHGCSDISENIDILHVCEYPTSTGGFGDVFCATLRDGSRVALKCVRLLVSSTGEGKGYLKRAARELYVWSKCRHPNILELLGVMVLRDQLAMVSPWVEHGHLRWFLSQHPQADRCALCAHIANGVEYMHENGITHGDLKPENILVASDNIPKLTDFGNSVLSEYTLHFSQSNTTPSISMRWTAPEIINEETKTTQAGDIYALGMVIFEVITGVLPFAGANDPAIMRRILTGQTPNRSETHMPTGVKQADRLWSLITRCWAFDPSARPEAQEIKKAMDGITAPGLLAN